MSGLSPTTRCRVRPALPSDYSTLYTMAVDPRHGFRWRYRGSIPSYEQFVDQFWVGITCHFVVTASDDDSALGLVSLYDLNLRGGNVYLSAIGVPAVHSTGLVVDAAIAVVDYAFSNWPIAKIYLDVLDINLPQFAWVLDYFIQEGRLVGHDRDGSRPIDLLILALYREAFMAHRERLLKQIWK
jgi:RimJ/RimL family protein N-acetyltransferase